MLFHGLVQMAEGLAYTVTSTTNYDERLSKPPASMFNRTRKLSSTTARSKTPQTLRLPDISQDPHIAFGSHVGHSSGKVILHLHF